MARDKLITIRIEGEKRDLFNQLAKSQNTDTASLLYDFISGCLDGTLDVGIVTGKKQRIDKMDSEGIDTNWIDNRLDKLETTTQKIDERLGIITKKLNDWVEAFDDRLTDCDRGLSGKIFSIEHRLNTLAIRLDSQRIDAIDTDSQQDSQRIDDMEYLLKRERECSIATSPIPPTGETSPPGLIDGAGDAIESLTPEVSPSPPEPAIETLSTVESGPGAIETVTDSKPWSTLDDLLDCHYPGWPETKEGLRKKAKREHWPKRTQRGSKGNPYEYQAVLPE